MVYFIEQVATQELDHLLSVDSACMSSGAPLLLRCLQCMVWAEMFRLQRTVLLVNDCD